MCLSLDKKNSIFGENVFGPRDSNLKLAYMDSLQLQVDSKKFSFENMERNSSLGLQFLEFSRMNLEHEKSHHHKHPANQEPKKTKYAAIAQYHTMAVDFSLNSLSNMLDKADPEEPNYGATLYPEVQITAEPCVQV